MTISRGSIVVVKDIFAEYTIDEGYLVLRPGDRVVVEFVGKQGEEIGWLFGHPKGHEEPPRGWFPQAVVVPAIVNYPATPTRPAAGHVAVVSATPAVHSGPSTPVVPAAPSAQGSTPARREEPPAPNHAAAVPTALQSPAAHHNVPAPAALAAPATQAAAPVGRQAAITTPPPAVHLAGAAAAPPPTAVNMESVAVPAAPALSAAQSLLAALTAPSTISCAPPQKAAVQLARVAAVPPPTAYATASSAVPTPVSRPTPSPAPSSVPAPVLAAAWLNAGVQPEQATHIQPAPPPQPLAQALPPPPPASTIAAPEPRLSSQALPPPPPVTQLGAAVLPGPPLRSPVAVNPEPGPGRSPAGSGEELRPAAPPRPDCPNQHLASLEAEPAALAVLEEAPAESSVPSSELLPAGSSGLVVAGSPGGTTSKPVSSAQAPLRQRASPTCAVGLVAAAAAGTAPATSTILGNCETLPPPGFERPFDQGVLDASRRGLKAGEDLPMASLCGKLANLVEEHRVVVIDAATGSGKSTLVPLVLAEQCAKLGRDCRIVVTQPRRLAAKGLARRVSEQCGTDVGEVVGFRVGNDRRDRGARVVYVTAGHLLEALVHNPQHLRSFSHLVLDEVHERFVEADFLMSLLRLWLSHPSTASVRLVVMSATLQKALAEFFRPLLLPIPCGAQPGELTLPGKTPFHVTEYFLEDLRKEWPNVLTNKEPDFSDFLKRGKVMSVRKRSDQLTKLCKELAPFAARLVCELRRNETSVVLVFLPGLDQIRDVEIALEKETLGGYDKPRVFTMHSSLDEEIYKGALDPVKGGEWRVVLATNIAESSLTIPDVSAVIDFGCHRVNVYDDDLRMSMLATEWCSRASMQQRRGRTGRTCSGCYVRLMPKAVADGLKDFDESGVERSPLQRVTLEAAHLADLLSAPPTLLAGIPVDVAGVGKGVASCWDGPRGWYVEFSADLDDHNSSYAVEALTPGEVDAKHMLGLLPTPPKEDRVAAALQELHELGALVVGDTPSAFGAACLKLPTDVCLGRLVVLGWSLGIAVDAVVLAAALSLAPAVDVFRTPFNTKSMLETQDLKQLRLAVQFRRQFDGGSFSEPLTLHALCMDWLRTGGCVLGRQPHTAWGHVVQTRVWTQFTEKMVDIAEALRRLVPAHAPASDSLKRLVERARGGRAGFPLQDTRTPHWKLSALITWALAPLGFVAVGQTPALFGGGAYDVFAKVVKQYHHKGASEELTLWWPRMKMEKAKEVVQCTGGMLRWSAELGDDAFTGIDSRENCELLSRICGPFNGKETLVGTISTRTVPVRPPRHPCAMHWFMPRRDGQGMLEVRVNWKSQAETLIHVPSPGERNGYCRPKRILVAAGGEYNSASGRRNVMLRGITMLPTDDGGRGALLWLLSAGLPREQQMVTLVAPRYSSHPGDFEVRALRMWQKTLCLPHGDPLSREDLLAVNAFRQALVELQSRRPHRLAGTWRRVGGGAECHFECLNAGSPADSRGDRQDDMLVAHLGAERLILRSVEGNSRTPPSRWQVTAHAGRSSLGGDAPFSGMEETLDGNLRWSDGTTWVRGSEVGRTRVEDAQAPLLDTIGQTTLSAFREAAGALLGATDPSAAGAGPVNSTVGRRWPPRLVPLRPQAGLKAGALTALDIELVEEQIKAFHSKLTESDALSEEENEDSEAESEDSSGPPVDATQQAVNEEFMWRLAENVDWEPDQSRGLCFVESTLALPMEVTCSECDLEGKTFSKRQMSLHPDDRKCEDCIAKAKNSVYRATTPGGPAVSSAGGGLNAPAIPVQCETFGILNVATCSKCGSQLTKANCTVSQRNKPPARRRCQNCVNLQ